HYSMAQGGGDSVSRLQEDVRNAKEGVEMRVAMLEEVFTSLQTCRWRDALNVSYPRPKSNSVSFTFDRSQFVNDQVCVEILVDNSGDEYMLTASTNPSSTTKWYLLDDCEKPTQILRPTTECPYRLVTAFPRSILFSSDHKTTVIVHLSKLEKSQSKEERLLSDAFMSNPCKDSFIVPIDISDAEEITVDSFRSLLQSSHDEFAIDRILWSLRLVYCTDTLPSIEVYMFQSRMGTSEFEQEGSGSHTILFGRGIFSGIFITTNRDASTYSQVLNSVYCRSNEELKRVVDWVNKLCVADER
ncbi:hypothetical protein PFISCL1PPCAC_9920, partial [Pristionchus fissidentatus]